MEPAPSDETPPAGPRPPSSGGRRSAGGAGSLLSRFPFVRGPPDSSRGDGDPDGLGAPRDAPPSQPKTRRRRGSLRKVALLGRGAQRDRREIPKPMAAANNENARPGRIQEPYPGPTSNPADRKAAAPSALPPGPRGLGIDMAAPAPRLPPDDGRAGRTAPVPPITVPPRHDLPEAEPSPTRYSTTDDEDALHMGRPHGHRDTPAPLLLPPPAPAPRPHRGGASSGSESPFPRARARRSGMAKSPLGPAASPAGGAGAAALAEAEWDYGETERWGWLLLAATWLVFVAGMGSCLGAWSWVWDVGTTPYAPPDLEDDPTLPIVGYYSALLILTPVMLWVWVVPAWVGMKYFKHAKISGD